MTDFGESLRFQTVLQGQEISPKSPYGRAPTNNEAHDIGSLGISDGLQVPGSIHNRHLYQIQECSVMKMTCTYKWQPNIKELKK